MLQSVLSLASGLSCPKKSLPWYLQVAQLSLSSNIYESQLNLSQCSKAHWQFALRVHKKICKYYRSNSNVRARIEQHLMVHMPYMRHACAGPALQLCPSACSAPPCRGGCWWYMRCRQPKLPMYLCQEVQGWCLGVAGLGGVGRRTHHSHAPSASAAQSASWPACQGMLHNFASKIWHHAASC